MATLSSAGGQHVCWQSISRRVLHALHMLSADCLLCMLQVDVTSKTEGRAFADASGVPLLIKYDARNANAVVHDVRDGLRDGEVSCFHILHSTHPDWLSTFAMVYALRSAQSLTSSALAPGLFPKKMSIPLPSFHISMCLFHAVELLTP